MEEKKRHYFEWVFFVFFFITSPIRIEIWKSLQQVLLASVTLEPKQPLMNQQ